MDKYNQKLDQNVYRYFTKEMEMKCEILEKLHF